MLEKILILLGIAEPTEAMTEKIETIVEMTEQRLKLMLGLSALADIPEELSFVIVEVAVSRFNRIGSEGVKTHTVQGESMAWSDDDFDPYLDYIQTWLNAQEEPTTTRGRVKFI